MFETQNPEGQETEVQTANQKRERLPKLPDGWTAILVNHYGNGSKQDKEAVAQALGVTPKQVDYLVGSIRKKMRESAGPDGYETKLCGEDSTSKTAYNKRVTSKPLTEKARKVEAWLEANLPSPKRRSTGENNLDADIQAIIATL